MVKRWFLVGLALLLVSLLTVGCGIPQEEYDAVVAERDAGQTQVASLQSDLAEAERQIDTLENDLNGAKGQIETLEGDLESAQSRTKTLQSNLSVVRAEHSTFKADLRSSWETYNGYVGLSYFVIAVHMAYYEDTPELIPVCASLITAVLDELNDSELQALWEQSYIEEGLDWTLNLDQLPVLFDKVTERMDSKGEVITEKLAE